METTLLIGNGLNRCLEGGIPWGDLLDRIADNFGVPVNKDIPMPLEFERLINTYLSKNPQKAENIYLSVKEMVAKCVSDASLPEHAIHHEILKLNIHAIITTNYDLLLESVYSADFVPSIHDGVAGTRTKYLLRDVGNVNVGEKSVYFYHAHGCRTHPSTICLGYEHYMGMVQTIRGKKGAIQATLNDSSKAQNTWIERLYTNNVAIIGLALYECETDLWWLLTHRASLYYSDPSGIHSNIKNRIVYYDVADDRMNDMEKKKEIEKKQALLNGLHIEVKTLYLSQTKSGTYEEAYRQILDRIGRDGI